MAEPQPQADPRMRLRKVFEELVVYWLPQAGETPTQAEKEHAELLIADSLDLSPSEDDFDAEKQRLAYVVAKVFDPAIRQQPDAPSGGGRKRNDGLIIHIIHEDEEAYCFMLRNCLDQGKQRVLLIRGQGEVTQAPDALEAIINPVFSKIPEIQLTCQLVCLASPLLNEEALVASAARMVASGRLQNQALLASQDAFIALAQALFGAEGEHATPAASRPAWPPAAQVPASGGGRAPAAAPPQAAPPPTGRSRAGRREQRRRIRQSLAAVKADTGRLEDGVAEEKKQLDELAQILAVRDPSSNEKHAPIVRNLILLLNAIACFVLPPPASQVDKNTTKPLFDCQHLLEIIVDELEEKTLYDPDKKLTLPELVAVTHELAKKQKMQDQAATMVHVIRTDQGFLQLARDFWCEAGAALKIFQALTAIAASLISGICNVAQTVSAAKQAAAAARQASATETVATAVTAIAENQGNGGNTGNTEPVGQPPQDSKPEQGAGGDSSSEDGSASGGGSPPSSDDGPPPSDGASPPDTSSGDDAGSGGAEPPSTDTLPTVDTTPPPADTAPGVEAPERPKPDSNVDASPADEPGSPGAEPPTSDSAPLPTVVYYPPPVVPDSAGDKIRRKHQRANHLAAQHWIPKSRQNRNRKKAEDQAAETRKKARAELQKRSEHSSDGAPPPDSSSGSGAPPVESPPPPPKKPQGPKSHGSKPPKGKTIKQRKREKEKQKIRDRA